MFWFCNIYCLLISESDLGTYYASIFPSGIPALVPTILNEPSFKVTESCLLIDYGYCFDVAVFELSESF